MKVYFHRAFKKQYRKTPKRIQTQFDRRLELLLENIEHPLLNVHQLAGSKEGLMSINVTGNYRALFILKGKSLTFYNIGTHSELYR